MASICKHIVTKARTDDVWSAIRDIGALHTRLVPGFVTDTRLERGARIVTFGNGMVLREPIIAVDDNARRLVWSAEGAPFTHYNASLHKSSPRTEAPHAWYGLLISCQMRLPAISTQRWMPPCKL